MSQLTLSPAVQNIWFRCGFTPAPIAIRADILQESLPTLAAHSHYNPFQLPLLLESGHSACAQKWLRVKKRANKLKPRISKSREVMINEIAPQIECASLRDPQGIIDVVLGKFPKCCFIHRVRPNEFIESRPSNIDPWLVRITSQCTPTVTFVQGGWRWEMGTRNMRWTLCQ
jgi:hypothetical protein